MFFRLPVQKRRLQKEWTLAFSLLQRKVEASKSCWQKRLPKPVVLEEHIILHDLRDVANAFATLMSLLYCLNIDYPKELKYTFEVMQKVFMGIGSGDCSARVHGLETRCFSTKFSGKLAKLMAAITVLYLEGTVAHVLWYSCSFKLNKTAFWMFFWCWSINFMYS